MTKYIVITLSILLCIFSIVNQIRYSKLQQEYLILQLNQPKQYDSLIYENKELTNKIFVLEDSLYQYSLVIDSLKHKKHNIIIHQTFKESESISDGVLLLKNNLRWEKY